MINLETLTDQEIIELKKALEAEHKKRGAKYKDDTKACTKLIELGFRDQLIKEGFRDKDKPENFYSEADHEVSDLAKVFWQLTDMCLGNYEVRIHKTRKDSLSGKDIVDHTIRRFNAFKTADMYDEYLKTCDEFLAVFEKNFKKRRGEKR